jgi:hypothetical protein
MVKFEIRDRMSNVARDSLTDDKSFLCLVFFCARTYWPEMFHRPGIQFTGESMNGLCSHACSPD